MADPFTLAAIGMTAGAAGAGTSALGSIMGGKAQAKMYQYQAGVSQLNKQIEEQNAAYSRHVGEVQAQQSGMKTRFEVGTTKAIQAASGLDVNTGSAVDVRESQQQIGSFNQAMIRSNAARQAYGHDISAMKEGAQVGVNRAAAAGVSSASKLSAFSSILGGVSNVSSKWLQGKEVGLLGGDAGNYGGSPETNWRLAPI